MPDNPLAADDDDEKPRKGSDDKVSFTLIRHGATALNRHNGAGDRVRGWTNVPLSAEGRQEARKLADRLRDSGLEVIVTSDLDRAKHTAEALARATGAEMVTTRKLRPWDLGDYTGQHSTEVIKELPQFLDDPDKRVPGGEAFNHFRERAFAGLREAVERAGGKSLAVVTHHRVERLLKAWLAKGQPEDGGLDLRTFLQRGEAPASVERVTVKAGRL